MRRAAQDGLRFGEFVARFGQLYLQKGRWAGRVLVPESWVEDATRKHISNGDPAAASDWTQGYGYQFWRCRHGLYRGDGAFGQFCIVMPEQDAANEFDRRIELVEAPRFGIVGKEITATVRIENQGGPAGPVRMTIRQNGRRALTPLALERRFPLNSVALFIGLLVWWYLWGVAGAILGVPLMVTINICCDHIEVLRPYGAFLRSQVNRATTT